MSGSAVLGRVPSDGLVAEFREVIVNLRPRADAEMIERHFDVASGVNGGGGCFSWSCFVRYLISLIWLLYAF